MSLCQVTTKYGMLRGVRKIAYVLFRGVPYAKPPLGSLRWKKPEKLMPWEGVREAKVFANRPVEGESPPGTFYHKEFFTDEDFLPPSSEDCLYLNIWVPADFNGVSGDKKYAVAFWIHGGAFISGFSSEMEFDGAAFAAQGVILVTVGHRLGALGYLAHPWLSAEGGGSSGNYGLYDLAAALDWVRENIAFFGGDPDRITMFGQSAGAFSVQALVSSKITRGKIHRAIIQSGGGCRMPQGHFNPPVEAEERGKEFAEQCKAPSLEALRTIPADKILAAQKICLNNPPKPGRGNGLPFAPVADGVLLEGDADSLLEQGLHHAIPYMIGCTADDVDMPPDRTGGENKPPLYDAALDFSLLNEKLKNRPSYVYYFTRRPLGDNAGAFHSAELWYIFGTLDRSWRPKEPKDYELSKLMTRYWCNFIKNGDPNRGDIPQWSPCISAYPFVKVF
ncbi:MAG: carboxylesterase family protein [Treponema sp.]|jgi:para-nitrobenzyl esterase|nr:carboxylesterase family protein [Treponema sp.]